jgi:hypothetical protein
VIPALAESPRVTELRRDIAEMEAQRDHLDPAMTDVLLASLREDLAEALGEAPEAPARPQVRPWPAPASLPTQTIPAAPAALEVPMPRKTAPAAERLEVLQKRLAATSTPRAAGIARMEIRKHCETHGLSVPPEAALVRDSCPKKFRKTTAPAPGAQGTTHPEGDPAQLAEARRLLMPTPAGMAEPYQRLVEHFSPEGPAPARIRALRSQALELLPLLEDMDPAQATAAHDEMDLLAQTLVLGGKLIARRTA